jgi:hypothetical protein
MHTLIIFLAWYIYFNKKGKIDTHCTKPGKWSVCVSIMHFLLEYMYQSRKVISVCIDLALFIYTSINRARSIHTLIIFLAWYMYFNKKDKIDAHTDHFPGLVIFIEVHVPSQERDQCVYRSCPFYWSNHFPGLVHVLQ